MKILLTGLLALVSAAPLVRGQAFSDNFSHNGTNAPWNVVSGNWTVTGNEMRGGTNTTSTYAFSNITNSWANYTVQGRFRFQAGAFGGGLSGRLNPATGSQYSAWIYPENSPGGSNTFKLIKFSDYSTFGYTNNPFIPMAQINLPAVGTNYHTIRLVFAGKQITASFDTNLVINITDADAVTYSSGSVGLNFWTDATGYLMNVDDILVTTAPPVASNDTYSATSGALLTVAAPGVLANDAGGNGPLTAALVTGPTHGTFSLSSNGGFTYTATNNYIGTDTFTYRANDGQTNSTAATVTLNVGANHAPVANNDSYSVLLNTTLNIGGPGVLANDTDQDGNALTASLLATTTNGTLTFSTNGGFTYTPTAGFVGSDTFTYRANDGFTNSTAGTVTITVLPAALFSDTFTREGPLAPWIAQSGNWAATGGVLQGGPNPTLSYAVCYITNRWNDYSVQARVRLPAGAFGGGLDGRLDATTGARYSVWIFPEGSPGGSNIVRLIKFQTWTGFGYNGVSGPVAETNVASVGTNFHTVKLAFVGTRIAVFFDGNQIISVTDTEATPYTSGGVSADLYTGDTAYQVALDDVIVMPLAGDNYYTSGSDTLLTVSAPGVLGDDTEVYGTNLTATIVSTTTHGTLNLNSNGGFTYLPATNYVGTDSFVYRANDGPTNIGTATANISVILMNHPPVLPAQTNRTINELTALVVTNKATDAETPANLLVYQLLTPPAGATIDTNGTINWSPTEAQGPGTYTITTRVTDNGSPAASATNNFNVTVNEVNLAPTLGIQTNRTINELTLLTVTNAAADADLPANTLTYSFLAAPTNAAISTAGIITWTPTEAQGPGTYTITTRVVDNGTPALSATNSFDVTVLDVNSAPIFPTQTNRTIAAGTPLVITNTATDTDIPANILTYAFVQAPSNAVISATGIISWTPGQDQDRSTNLFVTRVQDDGTPILGATNSFIVFVNSDPVVSINSTLLAQEGCSSTNNRIDPGESVTVLFSLKNTGLGNSTNLVVTLLTTNGVVVASGPQNYGALIAGGSAVSQPFTFSATGTCGGTFTASLAMHDGALDLGTTTTTLPLGGIGTVYTQSFDSVTIPALPAGWTTAASGAQANWLTTTNPLAAPPTNVAFCTSANTVGINELDTPPIVLPLGSSQLSFKHLYSLESSTLNTNTAYDGGVLEIKIGTNAYADILVAGGSFVAGGYNKTISGSFGSPITNRASWSGTNASYLTTIIDLPPTVSGQTVQFRWRCASDNGGQSGTGWRIHSISISGAACCINGAPVLPTQVNRTINELALLTVTNSASDDPANTLSYSLVNPPAGAQISANGIITWTPSEAQGPGTNDLTTIVTDNGYPALSATNSFQVIVAEVNSAPSLPAMPDLTIAELTGLVVTNTATDSDIPANHLTYSLQNAPAGALINVTNGVISWIPSESQGPGVFAITTIVTDDGTPALSATNIFNVTVLEANSPPQLSAQPNRTIAELTALTITNSAADPDLPANALAYQLENPPAGAVIDANGVITWTPSEAQGPSTNIIKTIVTDNGSPAMSATNEFMVVVTEVNSAPSLPLQADRTIDVLFALVVTNSATDTDLPANNLAYQLLVAPTNAAISPSGVITWTPASAQASSTNTFRTVVTDDGVPPLSATNTFLVVVNSLTNTAPPVITSITVSGEVATIVWTTIESKIYRLQYNDDIATTNWINVPPDVTATSTNATGTNAFGSVLQRFYRAVLLP